MVQEETNIIGFTDLLRDAIDWLRSLGIRVEGTRFTQYVKQLQEIVDIPGLQARTDDPRFELVLEALDSGGELLVIQRDLAQYDSPELRRRLAAFVKGPYLQREELVNTSSNQARNLGFELVFAAQLVKAKFTPVLPETGDLRTESPSILFECKRLQREGKTEKALKDARDQLRSTNADTPSFNVIALSIGKLLHKGEKFLHGADHNEVHRKLRGMVAGFVRKHERIWRAESFSHVAGIWLHYSGSAAFTQLNALVRASYNTVVLRPRPSEPEREAAIRILATELRKNLGFEPFAKSKPAN